MNSYMIFRDITGTIYEICRSDYRMDYTYYCSILKMYGITYCPKHTKIEDILY